MSSTLLSSITIGRRGVKSPPKEKPVKITQFSQIKVRVENSTLILKSVKILLPFFFI